MRNKKLKLNTMMLVGVIIVICFVSSFNVQPVVTGSLETFPSGGIDNSDSVYNLKSFSSSEQSINLLNELNNHPSKYVCCEDGTGRDIPSSFVRFFPNVFRLYISLIGYNRY